MNKRIHQSFIIYLALIMLLRMMAMPISLLDYSLNKTFIAGNFCENRSNPEMHCDGKCYLHKQLTKINDGPESQDQRGTVKNVLTDFFEPFHSHSFGCPVLMPDYTHPFISPFTDYPFSGNIFHPPIA